MVQRGPSWSEEYRVTKVLGELSIAAGVERHVLENGLTVLVKEVHAFPIVATALWYRVGARNEELGRTGTSHFLEHMLFKGTDRRPKGTIDLVTLRNGGSNNAFTWLDYTAYYFTFASDRWEVALEIEADRMRNVRFDPDEYEVEKKVVIEELQIGLDSPWEALEDEVWATAFRQHPYRNPTVGWLGDLLAATVDDMRAYYDRWYHPRNATLVLAGDFDAARALERVRELFGAIPSGPEPPAMRIVEPPQRGEKRVLVRKTTPVERLMIAYHAPRVADPDSYALQVAETALSGGKTSRFFRRLVEGDRSVTSVSANYGDHVDPSLFTIKAEVKAGHTLDEVERAIHEEIDRLAADGPSDSELARIKRKIRADLILSNEQALNQAILLGEYETICQGEHVPEDSRGYRYLATYLDTIDTVTAEDVRRVASAYLRADCRTVGRLVSDGGTKGEGGSAEEPENCETDAMEAAPDVPPESIARTARPRSAGRTGARSEGEPNGGGRRRALDVERFQLANGLTVLLAPNDGIPAFCLNVAVATGARYEADDDAGLASLAGGMLAEGTTRRSAREIAEVIEDTGGHLATFGGYAYSGTRVVGLAEDLALALDVAADCVRAPVYPEDRVRLQVERRLGTLRSRADQPKAVASDLFDEIVYAGHPAHRPSLGYPHTVARITREGLAAFHAAWFRPERTLVALAGGFDPADARESIERAFGDWERATGTVIPELPELGRQTTPVEKRVRLEKTQANVFLGHLGIRRSDPDYYALQVLDTILGSSPGFTSRIPRRLRDEQGLAYSTFSNIAGSAGLDPGRFVAFIGTSPGNVARALEGLTFEIRRIVEEPVAQDELEAAKSYLTGSFVFKFQTNSQIAGFLVKAEIFGLGFDYVERYPELIHAITIEDVHGAASRHIDPDALTLVVAGPDA